MDVTHFPEFGKTKYIHVSIDTFSGFILHRHTLGKLPKMPFLILFQPLPLWVNLHTLRQVMALHIPVLSLNCSVLLYKFAILLGFLIIPRVRAS
jgi:hypothetical protein